MKILKNWWADKESKGAGPAHSLLTSKENQKLFLSCSSYTLVLFIRDHIRSENICQPTRQKGIKISGESRARAAGHNIVDRRQERESWARELAFLDIIKIIYNDQPPQ